MKLWLLKPIDNDALWRTHPYDKAFGFVVRAENEEEARAFAQASGGDERHGSAWSSPEHSTCVELTAAGNAMIVLRDFNAA